MSERCPCCGAGFRTNLGFWFWANTINIPLLGIVTVLQVQHANAAWAAVSAFLVGTSLVFTLNDLVEWYRATSEQREAV